MGILFTKLMSNLYGLIDMNHPTSNDLWKFLLKELKFPSNNNSYRVLNDPYVTGYLDALHLIFKTSLWSKG